MPEEGIAEEGPPVPAQPWDEHETVPVKRAGFWRRWVAFVIDGIILSLVENFISCFIDLEGAPPWLSVAWGVVSILITGAYFVWPYSTSGQTVGKSILGIKVVAIDGSPLNWRKGILRYVGYIPSAIPLYLGFLWSIWDADKQAWHDKIAGTCVVRASVTREQLRGTIDPSEARRRQRRWLLGLGIPTLLIVVSGGICFLSLHLSSGEDFQAFRDLTSLHEQLITEYGEPNVEVEIQNGNTLGVLFINSSFNDLAEDRKAEQAREIALFVRENYASIDRIDRIGVAFVIHWEAALIEYTETLSTFIFEKSELESDDS